MNTKFLITAWVLLLGADELLMQVFKQVAQLLSSGATQESMQILYISGISLQLVIMLATVIFAMLALRDKKLKVMAMIASLTSGLKLLFTVVFLLIGLLSNGMPF